ncbi:hypothetical protein [Methylomonas sp. ZR1]|uniref:GapS6a family protein n=1 Tax=Methylomonas sp. ZR1 TaxID=1797072 RepID=UPI0014912834|nr:hypothetical protein [Methylomonas sp. ZR1]NOV29050.1 hypothetical protein [Methylomonas sp. ZR1]
MEEFLTATILSGIAYDVMKCGVVLSIDELKQRLKGWLISDTEIVILTDELKNLELTNQMSETAIERRILDSHQIQSIIKNIKPASEGNTIIQHHSGSGDNIGRDKIIHSGK